MTAQHMDLLAEISDTIQRLTNGWTVPITTPAADPDDRPDDNTIRHGEITYRGLIDQLYEALTDSTPDEAEAHARPVPDYRPPVPGEPFDVLLAIERFTRSAPAPWHQLVGWASTQPTDVAAALALELRALERRADIALGFAHPPRSVKGACPVCGRRNRILVDMSDDGPTGARCTACKAAWDTPTLGLLARALEAS